MHEILKKAFENSGRGIHMPFTSFREGISREEIRTTLERLKSAGIDSFIGCPRSSQYMGSGFWKDLDVMVEECQRMDMSFWIMDEQDFPTGSANGWVKNRRPDLAKLFIDRRHIDAVGPLKGASFSIDTWLDPNNFTEMMMEIIEGQHDGGTVLADFDKNARKYPDKNKLLAVLACRKNGDDGSIKNEVLDVTKHVRGGYLVWDVPEGFWRIIILFKTFKSTGRTYYINMIDRESVRLELDALYEPMYERYKQHFGKTFAGFFTDEPEFGNACGYGVDYDNGIGKRFFPLPWCKELEGVLKNEFGDLYLEKMPALWYDMGTEMTAMIREKYMDLITRFYQKNFVEQIGNWCIEHGCAYAGHVLEDGGNTTRLGAGAGHFFRAEKGQTIAGVDLVFDQIIPGFDSVSYYWTTGNHDGEEFTYSLAKMASSAAHIDPLKQGRALCETYLAYEAVHGLKHLKYNCDNLMSRGVNIMMPHFSPGEYDWYMNPAPVNPQYRYYAILTEYLNRICKIQSGGRHIAPAAVLYHAEAEWAGRYMNCARPIKVMTQDQIDCDIIPQDVFTMKDVYRTEYKPGALKVNDEEYRALVIPYSEYITEELAAAIGQLDIPVAFIDGLPTAVLGGNRELFEHCLKCDVVPLKDIAKWLRSKGAFDIELTKKSEGLRYYRYVHQGLTTYFFFNEFPYTDVNTEVMLPEIGAAVLYDPLSNRFFDAEAAASGAKMRVHLNLSPYETIMVIFGDVADIKVEKRPVFTKELPVTGEWKLEIAKSDDYPEFQEAGMVRELVNMGTPERYQSLYGTLRYTIAVRGKPGTDRIALDLGDAYETAEVTVNGKPAGVRICPPYRFDVSDLLTEGENRLVIDVTGTNRDLSSQTSMYEPFGLLGPVKFVY